MLGTSSGGLRVGVVGLGKLGLPVALTLEAAGHTVFGVESNLTRLAQIAAKNVPEADYEAGLGDLLLRSRLKLVDMDQLIRGYNPEIILVCVQTPHDPDFEGITPLRRAPQDFDYSYLKAAVSEIREQFTDALVVIVSTCLPGTFEREIRPIAGNLRIVYHPLFIAMGSVVADYRRPEFVLIGSDEDSGAAALYQMYAPLYEPAGWHVEFCEMSITSAELTKVAYNAAIGFKLMLANGIGELADRVGANADDVMDTLKCATDRIVSTQYMTPGMGDGGGCHPRDQIALSWLADEVGLSNDPFAEIIFAREDHARWLARLWAATAREYELPPVLLGAAYKPNTPLRTGSHALLVAHYLTQELYEPRIVDGPLGEYPVACYFLGATHDHFREARLPECSVVIDPWGWYTPNLPDVEVIRPGRRA